VPPEAPPPDRPAPAVPNPFRQPPMPPDQPRNPPPDRPRAPAPQPAAPPEPKPEPPKPERRPAELPPPPQPEPNPRAEHDKQIALGKAAFVNGEYGRAAHRFRVAIAAVPEEPMGQFLLVQALFALAKYQEAFDAIQVGMRQQPNWPTSRFRPLELYGDNVADYPDHLTRLEQLVQQQPDDPVLLFLYAYQLWFDGRQDEAIPLFQRAAPMLADKNAVERFLQARPPAPPLIARTVSRLPCCC
jgi:tetratricopeptide (TPR) repeat protein